MNLDAMTLILTINVMIFWNSRLNKKQKVEWIFCTCEVSPLVDMHFPSADVIMTANGEWICNFMAYFYFRVSLEKAHCKIIVFWTLDHLHVPFIRISLEITFIVCHFFGKQLFSSTWFTKHMNNHYSWIYSCTLVEKKMKDTHLYPMFLFGNTQIYFS